MLATAIFVFTLLQGALLVLAVLVVAWIFFLTLPGLFHGPPYVGTGAERLATVLEFSELGPGKRVVDLGSGDGRLLLAAAAVGASAMGYG